MLYEQKKSIELFVNCLQQNAKKKKDKIIWFTKAEKGLVLEERKEASKDGREEGKNISTFQSVIF